MNPLHQLTRRPVKAAFGVLLLALAGAILCLSGGQYWGRCPDPGRSGAKTIPRWRWSPAACSSFVTSGNIVMVDIGSTYEANAFLQEPAQQNWSIVRGQATMGLVSGYSPG